MDLCHSFVSYFSTYNLNTLFFLCFTPPLSIQGYQTACSFPCSPGSSSIDGLKIISVCSLDKSSILDFGSSIHQFFKNFVFSLEYPKPSFNQRPGQRTLPLGHQGYIACRVIIGVLRSVFPVLEAGSNVKQDQHMVVQGRSKNLQGRLLYQVQVLQKVKVSWHFSRSVKSPINRRN